MYVNCGGSGLQDILKNKKIIAVNQDPLGIQGRRIYKQKGETFLYKPTITFHNLCAENISVHVNHQRKCAQNVHFGSPRIQKNTKRKKLYFI
jgi:hypothetical protein